MKRILLTGVMVSLLMTIPFLASAQAGFRGDSGKHDSRQEYRDDRDHGKTQYRQQNNHYRHEVRHEKNHHKKRHVAKRPVIRHHYAPVRTRTVYRESRPVIVPVPGIVIGFPSVAVRIGW